MNLRTQLAEYIAACFTGLWIRTDNPRSEKLRTGRSRGE